ncbi:MAG: hypothetical protein VW082_07675 [Candidatus Nanopelagicales bacterium]
MTIAAEQGRMAQCGKYRFGPDEAGPWYQWGPYLAERAWGTVREDYSADGDAWRYLPYDQARSRTFRWSEDGILGYCDLHQDMSFSVALWNGRDAFLKERFFGLDGWQGNHGEDAKEYWWYDDAVPSHAWLRAHYHYPQGAFPYDELVSVNGSRSRQDPEYELLDTGIFDEDRYWVVDVAYAKNDPTDTSIRIRVTNVGPDADTLHLLPSAIFRDTWSWGQSRPVPQFVLDADTIVADHWRLGIYHLDAASASDGTAPEALFCDNRTNTERCFGEPLDDPYPKDGINDHVVSGAATVNPDRLGTKCAWHYVLDVPAGETVEVRLRLWSPSDGDHPDPGWFGQRFDDLMAQRQAEADEFYAGLVPTGASPDAADVMRRAFAGLIWCKQFYRYDVARWLDGDPTEPAPPAGHQLVRNARWRNLDAYDVLSMPDSWEYPWFAAWDLAFHTVVFAHIDPEYAKYQLQVMLRDWYSHPSGAIPAYEWNFDDVNPPVHAWAAIRVFEIDGGTDIDFLERVFQRLLINFTWWVNKVDKEGNNVFEGGFLGLDNIGPIDRSHLPDGYTIEQADGTAWMAFYALMMLRMAIRIAPHDEAYAPMALKFLEHFATITDGISAVGLFDAEEGFFYDQLVRPDGSREPIKVRSLVGVIPVLAGAYIEQDGTFGNSERYRRSVDNFLRRRGVTGSANEGEHVAGSLQFREVDGHRKALLTVVDPDRLRRVLMEILSEDSLLSPYGLRSLSKRLDGAPYEITVEGESYDIDYEPAESTTPIYGGNSNWRGPVWFPINHLVIEALERYHLYLGDEFQVECPTGSGIMMNLSQVAHEIRHRLISVFLERPDGTRPVFGGSERFQSDPRWHDPLFYEYFHGDNGAGLGASHQTGWTSLVADLIIGRKG